jgi:hypothetical protein
MINAETESRRDAEVTENLLSEQVHDATIEVHRTLDDKVVLIPAFNWTEYILSILQPEKKIIEKI